jgi:hypothetical protein
MTEIKIKFYESEIEVLTKALADSISLRINIEERFVAARRDCAARVYHEGTDKVHELLAKVIGTTQFHLHEAANAQSSKEAKEEKSR